MHASLPSCMLSFAPLQYSARPAVTWPMVQKLGRCCSCCHATAVWVTGADPTATASPVATSQTATLRSGSAPRDTSHMPSGEKDMACKSQVQLCLIWHLISQHQIQPNESTSRATSICGTCSARGGKSVAAVHVFVQGGSSSQMSFSSSQAAMRGSG